MFKNYLVSGWRNLRKNAVVSYINIVGLTIGLAVCILMIEYVAHEHSYDRFHAHADRIYWVQSKVVLDNTTYSTPSVEYKAAQYVKSRVPGVEGFTRLLKEREATIVEYKPSADGSAQQAADRSAQRSADLKFSENNVAFADCNFFHFFSFKLLSGNPAELLKNPYLVVVSQKIARKYFGHDNPLGKVLRFNNGDDFKVSGVAQDAPSNSSIKYDLLCSISSLATYNKGADMRGTEFQTYFLLQHSADAAKVETTLARMSDAEQGPVKVKVRYIATPIMETHLGSNFGDATNIKYLGVFPIVAALILLLAVVNYCSLATAGASARAKEIGVRKTLGAARPTIAWQFFSESALTTAVAFILGYALCLVCQPFFFRFLGIDIDQSFLFSPYMLLSFIGLFGLTVVLAAVYPAVVLSAFNPSQVLYGRATRQKGGLILRTVFTSFQFTVAVALIICGLVIHRQMNFFRHSDTGVRRSNILMVPFSKDAGLHYAAFKKDIGSLPAVQAVSTCSYPMYSVYDITVIPGPNGKGFIPLPQLHVDANFIPMLGLSWKIPPLDGSYAARANYAVLNETAVEKIGLKGNPINQVVNGQFTVTGVLRDFNYSSLQDKIDAMVLCFNQDGDTTSGWAKQGGCLFARIGPGANLPTVLDQVQAIHAKYDAASPFDYHFMDDAFNSLYSAEDKLAKIFSAFTLFTIVIACLGLLGMSIFAVSRRSKEISIRKVLGAGVPSIAARLSAGFLRPILVAVAIASPVGWYCMNRWLQGFAYRVHMNGWILLAAAALALLIALLTISVLVFRSAIASPINSLRSE